MQTETPNLILIPLSIEQLNKFAHNDGSLEAELGVNNSPRIVPENFQSSLESRIFPNMKDATKNALYYTIWIGITKAENMIVSTICFKGEANEKRESELGAATLGPHENKGYMTETLGGILKWAKSDGALRVVTAETNKNNTASIRVLQKNGFILVHENEESFLWKKTL